MLRRDRRVSTNTNYTVVSSSSNNIGGGGTSVMSNYNSGKGNSNNSSNSAAATSSSVSPLTTISVPATGGGGVGYAVSSPLRHGNGSVASVLPDAGVFGQMSTRAHAMLGTVLPAVCYVLALCCFIALMQSPSLPASVPPPPQQQQQRTTSAVVVTMLANDDDGEAAVDDSAATAAAVARTTNVLLSALLTLCVTATFLRRSVRYLWTEPGRLSYASVGAISSQLVPRSLRGRACVYVWVADMVTLPLCLALSVYRSDAVGGGVDDAVVLLTRLGALFYPPPSEAVVLFTLLFWLVPTAAVTVLTALYVRHITRERVDPYYTDGRRALTPGGVLALAAAVLLMPSLCIASSALPCSPWGTLRFAEAVTCRSRTHRLYMCASFVWLGVCGLLLELVTGALYSLVGDGGCAPVALVANTAGSPVAAMTSSGATTAATAAAAACERRNDALALELQLLLRWLVVLAASLSGDALRCGIVALVAGLVLSHTLRTPVSSVAVLDFLLRAVVAVTLTSSVACALTQVLGLSSGYGLAVWLLVWLGTLNTHIVVYMMRWHTTLFAPREDTTYGILLA